ncbi:glutamine-synthetase adenylyltransferase [Rugosibacter aromaticivorans]|uniref:Bifunctional glutamine synthetase adenylyltransferase/adenylyl-removing enzyme n=1 Tax=Rugosibacter aromaticivorans TaxID=1565605 RepID=A0A0C5J907_9PROT|nr:bifunctional [glutamate--ammonia ligase]-adenylyl-L-tyrosine phosphorylase/[glutamate--ammonia-ligase] adenylyltransferase [Rugosibacter aromaticivorans]AJP48104.1 glutamine-synthetase adenylyltransferase [Rugosibacter aromaticivorans]
MPYMANVLAHSIADGISASRYLERLLTTKPALAAEVAASLKTPVTRTELSGWLGARQAAIPSNEEERLKPLLRQFKQWAYARIATRDLANLAPLAEVMETMTCIAELAINQAVSVLMSGLVARYGVPRNADGLEQSLVVIGMGKLGGRELNVSSDIDLIFAYPDDGDTDAASPGLRSISNSEFFTRLGRGLINAMADITSDGQVFRVDMRLRPNGDSGPLVCSFNMLENYFITQGREWERYAWIKARPLTGDRHDELEHIRRPFVFRKYLDFGAINAMRDLHAQIRHEVMKKDQADNVKLGPGGIREIEFIAQVFQLIRGGRDTTLQVQPTLAVLQLLSDNRTLPPEVAMALASAYDFLRRVEHRLQYLDDAQTHTLPTLPDDQQRIAQSMNFVDFVALTATLNAHRAVVSGHFEQVFASPDADQHPLDLLWHKATSEVTEDFERLGFHNPTAAAMQVAALRVAPRYQQMPDEIRRRFDVLVPRLIEAASQERNPDETLLRGLSFLDVISRRGAYLALLQQYPIALQKVVNLLGSSRWAASYLEQHPILLDELLDQRLLEVAPDWSAFRRQLQQALLALEPDTERQMDVLREQHHAQVFRVLMQDMAGLLTVEKLSDHLSDLADSLLEAALACAWKKLPKRHRESPRFAVISYGKLGGKELGYASDLDLVFLYDDTDPDAGEIYSRLGTRLNTWLSAQTSAGQLFETDLRLRPNGEAGLVVSSIAAFRAYQLESAWVWEHQALTRARYSAGDVTVGAAFEDIRRDVLCQARDLAKLKEDVLAMRQKILDAHATRGDKRAQIFNLKHDPGGLIDVEFIVQYLVLGYAHKHTALTGNLGNIALLKIAADLSLIPAELANAARNAYRDFRHRQHGLRLNFAQANVSPDEIEPQINAVRALWHVVFES